MQKLKMILILCFWSCTGLTQSDSIICFTKGQVQTFLITKVELNSCLEQYNAIVVDLNTLTDSNNKLLVDYTDLEIKTVRRGKIAIGVIILALIEGVGIAMLIK